MKPKVWTFTICFNEARMAPWFIRHYEPWVERMVIWDEASTDGTQEILRACKQVDLRPWPHRGLDDNRFLEAVNGWYQEARGKADWIAWVDIDELLFHPYMSELLEKANTDILPASGYALISPSGWPDPKTPGQLYEHIRTGARQENFDKKLIWRPSLDVTHGFGRHSYPGQFPKHNGKEVADAGIKLFHCHHVGGVEDTAQRNRRNYARALDKKFAWNYAPGHNENPKQSGSVAWVKAAIEQDLLIDVVSGGKALKKLHFGAGGGQLPGWTNTDVPQVDIRKPLPFDTNSASHIFLEHCLEHVSMREAWNFIGECHRVLAPAGIVRIAIPDLVRMRRKMTKEYQDAVKAGGHGDGSVEAALKAAVFEHGHQGVWTAELLETFLIANGFSAKECECGKSKHPELNDIEQHWRVVGRGVAEVETSVVEGTKPIDGSAVPD